MASINLATVQNGQEMTEMLKSLAGIYHPAPPPRRRSSHPLRPRSTRPARSPTYSLCLVRLRRTRGRLIKSGLFHPPPQLTDEHFAHPATQIVANTPKATLISCVFNGQQGFFFGVAPFAKRTATMKCQGRIREQVIRQYRDRCYVDVPGWVLCILAHAIR
jgi:hypothetical protein